MARILIIEDEPTIVLVLKTILNDEGYEVLTASDGNIGLKLLKEELIPDVAIIDLKLPGIDGHRLVEIIRSDVDLQNISILILSGSIPNHNFPQEGSYNAFIQKPFSLDDILETVGRLTAKQNKLAGN